MGVTDDFKKFPYTYKFYDGFSVQYLNIYKRSGSLLSRFFSSGVRVALIYPNSRGWINHNEGIYQANFDSNGL